MQLTLLLAALAWWTVDPMSSERYVPFEIPREAEKGGTVEVLAARGEYESGSFVVRSDASVTGAKLAWGDFVSKNGAKIPASALDAKVVLCWYQQGTAWYAFHADMTRRVLTPELLVHDEKLVRNDYATQDSFVRTDHEDGTTDWYWTTYTPLDCNLSDSYYGFRNKWVHDAPTLRPFDLEKDRSKQFWLTFAVPKDAKPGLYRGEVEIVGGGGGEGGENPTIQQSNNPTIATIPISIRVLPFELPPAGTFRDPDRRFYASMYTGPECRVGNDERIAADYARHNLTSPFLEEYPDEVRANELYDLIQHYGFDTTMLFSHLPGAGFTMSDPADPNDELWDRYNNFLYMLSNTVRRIRAKFGDKAVPFAYGIDEAGAAKVRAERTAWQRVQALGGRTIVATQMRPYILYALDAACIPMQPSLSRKAWCDVLHESNPEMLVGWYADPHSGPENPDLARRQYGWQSWRNNYDMVVQYVMFVRGWSEFNRCYENGLRSLTMAYMGDGQVIDTLQFEGFREAIDDIRYGTLLKKLALAASQSKDVDVMYAGRAALTWLAQVPYESVSLKGLRYEMVEKILKLLDMKVGVGGVGRGVGGGQGEGRAK